MNFKINALEELKNRIEETSADGAFKAQREQLEQEITDLKEERDAIKDQKETLENELLTKSNDFKKTIADLESQIIKKDEEINRLKDELEKVIEDASDLKEKHQKLRSEYQEHLRKKLMKKKKNYQWFLLGSGFTVTVFVILLLRHLAGSVVLAYLNQPEFWYCVVGGAALVLIAISVRKKYRKWSIFLFFLSTVLFLEYLSNGFIFRNAHNAYVKNWKWTPSTDSEEEKPIDEKKEDKKDTVPELVAMDTAKYIKQIASLSEQIKQGKVREEVLKVKNNASALDLKKVTNQLSVLKKTQKPDSSSYYKAKFLAAQKSERQIALKIEALQKQLVLAKKPSAAIVSDPKDKARIAELEKTIRELVAVQREKREEKVGYVLPKGVRPYREIN